jgi:hypothetical protein
LQLQRVNVTLFLQDEDTKCAIIAVNCIFNAFSHKNPDITSKMVDFGCVSPLVKILTKQNSTHNQKLLALNAIYCIKLTENFSHSGLGGVPTILNLYQADALVEAIANLQVGVSFF